MSTRDTNQDLVNPTTNIGYDDYPKEEKAAANKPYNFSEDIKKFNSMYNMPCNPSPTILFSSREQLVDRLIQLRKILEDEVMEVDDIIEDHIEQGAGPLEVLTHLADWLGDLQIFCASEMRKFGLDNDIVLGIIMQSNFSKLQADGTPLMVEGKLQKGPNYWKPEPQIQRYIQAAAREAAAIAAAKQMAEAIKKEQEK